MSSVARPSFVADRLDATASLRWTSKDVERWLKAGSAAMLHTAILAPGGSTLRTAAGDTPSATFDIIAFTGTVLGEKSAERRALLVWARAKVSRGAYGGSIAQLCVELGWKRSTFEARRRRACERVARAKNAAISGTPLQEPTRRPS